MDLRVQKRTMEWLYYLFTQKNEEAARIPFTPSKRVLAQDFPESTRLERAVPEQEGVSSAYLQTFWNGLRQDPDMHVHTCMILRHGKVISEGSFAPYRGDLWHATYSVCKSLTGLAVGLLIDEGKLCLEDRIVKLLEDQAGPLAILRQSQLTLRHLLTMTSGVVYNEAASITEEEWMKGFLESSVKGTPGEQFQYNSMNSYVLASIVCRVSGRNLSDYLTEKIFRPMGIHRVHWETSPEGIEKGGWGLYMTPEDMAKIGQLFLQKGRWEGRQLVSAEWIEESCRKQVDAGEYGYGYQIWMGREVGSFQMNGMLGQNVMVFPRTEMVIVTTAGNIELEARCLLTRYIEDFFGEGFEPEERVTDLAAYQALQSLQQHPERCWQPQAAIANRRFPWKRERHTGGCDWARGIRLLTGQSYRLKRGSATLLPVFIQATQNNFPPAITRISFYQEQQGFWILMEAGSETYRLRIGFDRGCEQRLRVRGEVYWISVQGEFCQNEDHILVLRLRMCFLECANERHIKFYLQPDGLVSWWSEMPGPEMALDAIDVVASGGLVGTIISRMDPGFFVYKLKKTFQPQVFWEIEDETVSDAD